MPKKFHVYKDKQNVKVDIGHQWSSEEDTLLVLCKVVHPFLLAFYFCCNKKYNDLTSALSYLQIS